MINQKIIEKIIQELLDDDAFVYECRKEIEDIFEDQKIDIDDIPEILSLIIIISQKYYLFMNITDDDIYEIFSILIIELFKKFNILQEENDNPKINKILQSSLKLLVYHVKIKKSKWSCWCF